MELNLVIDIDLFVRCQKLTTKKKEEKKVLYHTLDGVKICFPWKKVKTPKFRHPNFSVLKKVLKDTLDGVKKLICFPWKKVGDLFFFFFCPRLFFLVLSYHQFSLVLSYFMVTSSSILCSLYQRTVIKYMFRFENTFSMQSITVTCSCLMFVAIVIFDIQTGR